MADLSFNLGLAELPELRDPTLFAELVRVYNAIKIVAEKADIAAGTYPGDSSETYTSGASVRISGLIANEDISIGTLVEIYNYGGTARVRKASFDNFHGFCSSNENVLAGDAIQVTLFGIYPYGGGSLTPAAKYEAYGTLTPDSGRGQIAPVGTTTGALYIGYALTPDLLFFSGRLN